MGTFTYKIAIAPLTDGDFQELDVLVDGRSTYMQVPGSVLERIGVIPDDRVPFMLADGTVTKYPVAEVRLRLDGHTADTLCVFGDEGTHSILGSLALKALGLAVDQEHGRLVRVPGLPVSPREVAP